MNVNVILSHVRITIVALENQEVLNILSFLSVALIIHQAMRMRRITLSPVSCMTTIFLHSIS
jgi:hypothetical protein